MTAPRLPASLNQLGGNALSYVTAQGDRWLASGSVVTRFAGANQSGAALGAYAMPASGRCWIASTRARRPSPVADPLAEDSGIARATQRADWRPGHGSRDKEPSRAPVAASLKFVESRDDHQLHGPDLLIALDREELRDLFGGVNTDVQTSWWRLRPAPLHSRGFRIHSRRATPSTTLRARARTQIGCCHR